MQPTVTQFWELFANKDFTKASLALDALSSVEKEQVLACLFQQSQNATEPYLLSCFEGKLKEDETFASFRESWLPPKDKCNPVDICGETYQQFFPIVTRVINAVSIDDPTKIFTIGMTWAHSEAEQKAILEKIDEMRSGQDESNQTRHDNISQTTPGRQSIGMYIVKSDDNLGTPF